MREGPVEATIGFDLLNENASVPKRATPGSSGWDLCACEETVIPAGKWSMVKTGVTVEIPLGYEGQVRSRSGLAFKEGIFVLNSPGTIDSDYRGEIGVILANMSDSDRPVKIGERVAQLVITRVTDVVFLKKDSLSETERGSGGFGSTG